MSYLPIGDSRYRNMYHISHNWELINNNKKRLKPNHAESKTKKCTRTIVILLTHKVHKNLKTTGLPVTMAGIYIQCCYKKIQCSYRVLSDDTSEN